MKRLETDSESCVYVCVCVCVCVCLVRSGRSIFFILKIEEIFGLSRNICGR